MKFLFPLLTFLLLLFPMDRFFFKANGSFCLHFIAVKPSENTPWKTDLPFPDILQQSFSYLGKGAQSFVFESEDHDYVLKLYKFPSHMRKFGWTGHPFGYRFSPKRLALKDHNEKRLFLSYNSYFLALHDLQDETGVEYIHLTPTSTGNSLSIIDKLGHHYKLPADDFGFVLQRKGKPFMPLFSATVEQGDTKTAEHMIDSLINLIASRCSKGITDLDNIDHDNYGWAHGKAIHLDIGRFTQSEKIDIRAEVKRITQLLADYLQNTSPELLAYYERRIQLLNS